MDQEQYKRAVMTFCGGIIALVALFFPLLTVTYAPPGGSAIVYGQRMAAFVYTMNGWQFANRATYFLLRPTIILLLSLAGIDFIRLLLPSSSASSVISTIAHIFHLKPTGIILDFVQAFVHVVISFTWLLVLLLVVIFASVTMPTSGEAGIAASFQVTPQLMPTGQAAIGPGPTPYLSAALDIGYYLLLI